MVTSRRTVALAVALVVLVGCAGPSSPDPLGDRPYLVAVDPLDETFDGEVTGTLTVERDCVLFDGDDGLVLPLFGAQPTRWGPRDGGGLTIDTGGERLRIGDEVTFAATTGQVTDGLRSRYPGVDTTRCGVRGFALLGPVVR